MRVLHIGMGEWGISWFHVLQERKDITIVGVVDLDESKRVMHNKFYTDVALAMDELKPDFIVNATPPSAHQQINRLACERNISILCEKPISESYSDALELLDYARKGHKIVIAENYRYIDINRRVKDVIASGVLGEITSINIKFGKRHRMTNYHSNLKHPLLLDVTMHHMDLLRYFSDLEVKGVYADFFTPEWSWYKGYSNVVTTMTLTNGIHVQYCGSLDAHLETSWNGSWEFVGANGSLLFEQDRVYLHKNGESQILHAIDEHAPSDKDLLLDEFLDYLRWGKIPQTHIFDNIKTFQIIREAITSFKIRKEVQIDAN